MREPRDNPTKSILLIIYVYGTHLRICLDSKDDVAFGTHTDVEIIKVYYGARYGACLAVQCCGLLEKSGEDSEGMGMDRFQLTVRREELSRSNIALCPCPVDTEVRALSH